MIEIYMEEWVNEIIGVEGMRLMPYHNLAGKEFIGVKRCLTDFPLNAEERRAVDDYQHGITENGAKMLLRTDLRRCYEILKRLIKEFEKTDKDRQFVLLYFCWYSGKAGIRKYYQLLKYVERRNFVMATYEFLQTPMAQKRPKLAQKMARALKTGKWCAK